MRTKQILFGLLFIILILNTSFIFAENKNIRYYYENIDEAKEELKNNINQIPKTFEKILQKDKIYIQVNTSTEQLNFFLEKTKEGYTLTKNNLDNINVWIVTKEETVNRILDSENPLTDIKEGIKTKEIEIKTKGFFKKIKYKVAQFFLKFVN
jgi:predicted PurR-regulated permease PerM